MRFNIFLIGLLISFFFAFAGDNSGGNIDVKQYNQLVERYNKEIENIYKDPKYKEFFNKNKGQAGNSVNNNTPNVEGGNLSDDFLKYREEVEAEEGWSPITSYKYYLFISSSIPKQTLYNYALSIYDYNSKNPNDKVVMVIRGCINNCTKLKPTLDFIKDVVTVGGKYNKGLNGVEVWIDPTLFRYFKINKVPCLASKRNGKYTCGDWSLEYLLSRIK